MFCTYSSSVNIHNRGKLLILLTVKFISISERVQFDIRWICIFVDVCFYNIFLHQIRVAVLGAANVVYNATLNTYTERALE